MMPLRIVVVEDQPLAREQLAGLLTRRPEVVVVAKCANGAEAVEAIPTLEPDVVFLDIQMPELSGFDVIEAIGVDRMPPVVFVTAYDTYALRAFEVHAFDYLLKPYGEARIEAVLDRVRKTIADPRGGHASRYAKLLADPPLAEARERIVLRCGGRVLFVRRQEIAWVEAAGNYMRVRTADAEYEIRERMREIAQRLGPSFARIHRSTLVNLAFVRELQVASGGDYDVVLRTGRRLRVSRLYRRSLEERLKALD